MLNRGWRVSGTFGSNTSLIPDLEGVEFVFSQDIIYFCLPKEIPTLIMSYTRLLYHLIFRPQNSIPAITIEYEKDLYRYIWGIVKEKGGVLYRIGGMPDHIHLLIQLPPTMALSAFMHDMKIATHKYLCAQKEKFPLFTGWGKSYCALTCSAMEKDKVITYIKNQKMHHQRRSSQDELLDLLQTNGIAVDMKYFLK